MNENERTGWRRHNLLESSSYNYRSSITNLFQRLRTIASSKPQFLSPSSSTMPKAHHTPTTGESPSNDSPPAASKEHSKDAIGAENDVPGGRAIQTDMTVAQVEPKKKKKKNGKKGVSLMLENSLSRERSADVY
jgi:hypothetical protein